MKRIFSGMLALILLLSFFSVVQAAELLDVKPVVAGNSVSVEVTADVSMTYTYYKVPGQARAVVDIADADPEKVEPLIVVNKGPVSSISVDMAKISGMVVSRLVFNLVAESDISVKSSPDRKKLTVTFGGASAAAATPPTAPQAAPAKAEPEEAVQKSAEPVKKAEPAPAVQKAEAEPAKPASSDASKEEDDPLGLDEPAAPAPKKAAPATPPPSGSMSSAKANKLEPVVPIGSPANASAVRKVVVGNSSIDIQANGQVGDFKVIKLSKPERLAIDIPGVKSSQAGKSVAINKFGVSKVRVGVYPEYVRIVLDSSKAEFPKYTVTNIQDGLRISFK